MNTQTKKQEATLDQMIALKGIREMEHATALEFLAKKLAYIEGRGIAAEYTSLAFEYDQIGEEETAMKLRRTAEELKAKEMRYG